MISIQQANNLINAEAKSFGTETVSINEALNRVLADDVYADRDYPPFNRSAMDGFAVQSTDFKGVGTQLQLIEKLLAGGVSTQKVTSGNCIKIMTGAPVPDGADAVVRVEDCKEEGEFVHFNVNQVKKNQNIAQQAEDASIGDLIMRKNTFLNAPAIAVLAVLGKAKVNVYKTPRVTVLSTGNEIVPVDADLLPHQIRDSNSYALKNFLAGYAINQVATLHVADDKNKLKETIAHYLNDDILILSGGVSKGDADYVPEALQSLGVVEVFHRVKIKPGAPLWFGRKDGGVVVFGLPGNPVSVQVAFKVFIEPFLRKCFGLADLQPIYLPLLNQKVKKTKLTEYFPCKLVTENRRTGLSSSKMNGSGDVAATLFSQGIAVHPESVENISENEIIAFYPWKSGNE